MSHMRRDTTMEPLKKKLLKGAFWNSLSQFGAQGINFIVIITLARILEVEDFGLLGMVTVITGFVGYFSEFGIIASLIKKRNVDDLDCSTGFWLGLGSSLIVYFALFFIAPMISWFYNQPELTDITRVISLVFPIGALVYLPIALETKSLRYDRITKVRLVSIFLSGAIAITLALTGSGIWSLVIQQVVMKICEVVGLVIATKFFPTFLFSRSRALEIIGFGKHMMVNNFIKFFSENIDYLLVGKLLGASSLGIYTIAFRISKYPIEKICQVLANILFPAYSSIQDDNQKLKKIYYQVSAAGVIVTVPVLSVILFGTYEFVQLSVGSKWSDAIPFIKILTFYLIFMSMSLGDEAVLTLLNIKKLNLVKLIATIIFSIFAFFIIKKYGLIGLSITYTIIFSIYWIIIKYVALSSLEISIYDFMKIFIRIFIYVLLIFLTAYIFSLLNITNYSFVNLMIIAIPVFIVSMVILYANGGLNFKYPYIEVENMLNQKP